MKFGKKRLKENKSIGPISFTKMHGLRNDFVVIENMDQRYRLTAGQVAFLCDRREGVGGDGLILLEKHELCDAEMRYYNSDGGRAQVCGNGLRCAAKYLFDAGIIEKEAFTLRCGEQDYGVKIIEKDAAGKAEEVDVAMGQVRFGLPAGSEEDEPQEHSLLLDDKTMIFYAAEMPNPHAVFFVENIDKGEMVRVAAVLGADTERYPQGVNVSFVEPFNVEEAKALTLERGSGITDACGSAACAIGAVMYKKGLCGENIAIFMPGGRLAISLFTSDGKTHCAMCAPAETAFVGEIII